VLKKNNNQNYSGVLYNKRAQINVMLIVMKTTEKRNFDFERKPQYRNFIYFSEFEEGTERKEIQSFVVPWQMVETKKDKYVIE
jgi:hypothetical protein